MTTAAAATVWATGTRLLARLSPHCGAPATNRQLLSSAQARCAGRRGIRQAPATASALSGRARAAPAAGGARSRKIWNGREKALSRATPRAQTSELRRDTPLPLLKEPAGNKQPPLTWWQLRGRRRHRDPRRAGPARRPPARVNDAVVPSAKRYYLPSPAILR